MTAQHDTAVWWVKRDFRVSDNEALTAAAKHQHLLVLFIVEPSVLESPDTSAFHLQAQLQAARHLQLCLRQTGSELFFVLEEAVEIFESIFKVIGPFKLYAHQETGNNLTFARDKAVQAWCDKNGLPFAEAHQNGVIRGQHTRDERPVVLAQRLLQSKPLQAPQQLPPPPQYVRNVPSISKRLPELKECNARAVTAEQLLSSAGTKPVHHEQLQTLDESSASQVLQSFMLTRGVNYSGGISSPNRAFDCGSRLSAHLAWGTISLRSVFAAVAERKQILNESNERHSARWHKSLSGFQSRLYWHDHFIQRFESACQMEFETLNPAYQRLTYPQSDTNLQAWLNGMTGMPLVDACIRCLQSGGFVNFRMRALLVSVACYGLGLHWKTIQYPLARLFYDYEPGIHFSQIQMQAGVVGINTIRVYNPHKQLLEQDPECVFVHRWVEELREFNAVQIHNYQTQPLGDYPAPRCDFDNTAKLMKERIFTIRNSDEGKSASRDVLAAHGSQRTSRRHPPRSKTSNNSPASHRQSAKSNGKTSKANELPESTQQQLKLDF